MTTVEEPSQWNRNVMELGTKSGCRSIFRIFFQVAFDWNSARSSEEFATQLQSDTLVILRRTRVGNGISFRNSNPVYSSRRSCKRAQPGDSRRLTFKGREAEVLTGVRKLSAQVTRCLWLWHPIAKWDSSSPSLASVPFRRVVTAGIWTQHLGSCFFRHVSRHPSGTTIQYSMSRRGLPAPVISPDPRRTLFVVNAIFGGWGAKTRGQQHCGRHRKIYLYKGSSIYPRLRRFGCAKDNCTGYLVGGVQGRSQSLSRINHTP